VLRTQGKNLILFEWFQNKILKHFWLLFGDNEFVFVEPGCTCWGWLGMTVVRGRAMYCVMLIELWHHSIVGQKCIALKIIYKIIISLILIRALQIKITEIACLVWSSRRSTEGERAGRWGTSSLCSETQQILFCANRMNKTVIIINNFLSLSERSQS
jgi:predicted nucleic acid-binding Zn finger protein